MAQVLIHTPPETAIDLLKAQNWSLGGDGKWTRDGVPVILKLVTDRSLSRAAVVLADQFEQFGIALDVQVLEPAALQEAVKSGDYDLTVFATSTLGDPGSVARRVLAPVWNSDAYPDVDRAIKALLNAQARARNPEERRAILQQLQSLYAERLPSMMLANPIWAAAYNGKVEPHFLPDGVAIGIPSALHKSMFMR